MLKIIYYLVLGIGLFTSVEILLFLLIADCLGYLKNEKDD